MITSCYNYEFQNRSLKSTLFISFFFFWSCTLLAQGVFKRAVGLMGSDFEITVVAQDSTTAASYIDLAVVEISRIERLISSWNKNSQTSLINANAGKDRVQVDAELFELIERAQHISKLTNGAFDISYAAMDKLWKFDGSQTTLPSKDLIKKSIVNVGFKNIVLHKTDRSIALRKEGMKIGFGAIGKGYAADKARRLLEKKGVKSGIINDERYTHIIDPRTGYPSKGIVSASVFASSAELADALATALFVMGKEVGMHRINQLPGVECILIDSEGKVHSSANIKIDAK